LVKPLLRVIISLGLDSILNISSLGCCRVAVGRPSAGTYLVLFNDTTIIVVQLLISEIVDNTIVVFQVLLLLLLDEFVIKRCIVIKSLLFDGCEIISH
jgi:hypothetical protein